MSGLARVAAIAWIGLLAVMVVRPGYGQADRPSSPTLSSAAATTAALPGVDRRPTSPTLAIPKPQYAYWKELTLPNLPSPRLRPRAVFATDRQRLILVGGYLESKEYSKETWEFDGESWKRMPFPGPPAGASFSLAYDQHRGTAVFYGGGRETWEYDGKQWKQVFSQSSPPIIGFGAMAYDVNRQVCVLFGGETAPTTGSILPELCDQTWQYDGHDWIKLDFAGPLPRKYHQMVYDNARQRFVLFGGFSRRTLNDTWELRPQGWRPVRTRRAPSPRRGFSLTYDPIGKRTLLFGGYPGGDHLWAFDGADWTRIMAKDNPPPREGASLAYIPTTRKVLMFGGLSDRLLNDFWEFHRGPIQASLLIPPPPGPGDTDTPRIPDVQPQPEIEPPPPPDAPATSKTAVVSIPEPGQGRPTTESAALADLRFENVSISPRQLSPTTVLAIQGRVLNSGKAAAQCWVEFWLSQEREPFAHNYLLCRSQLVDLEPGGSYNLSLILRMPYEGIPAGQYYLGVEADRPNQVTEEDETNNRVVLDKPYTVTGGKEG